MRDACKDLVSAAGIGAGRRVPMPVLAAAAATCQMALCQGHRDKDKGGVIRVVEGPPGVRRRGTPAG